MLQRLTSSELAEYMAFDHFEPIGEARADLRAGILASTFVNHSASPPRSPVKPVDFMPFARGFDRTLTSGEEAIALGNPDEQAKLVAKTLFGDRVTRHVQEND